MLGSMGRVGATGDNVALESFFTLLQKNVLERRGWATRDALRLAGVTWIERNYHRRRRQARLGRLTPVEYEAIMNGQVALAARHSGHLNVQQPHTINYAGPVRLLLPIGSKPSTVCEGGIIPSAATCILVESRPPRNTVPSVFSVTQR